MAAISCKCARFVTCAGAPTGRLTVIVTELEPFNTIIYVISKAYLLEGAKQYGQKLKRHLKKDG